MKIISGTLHQYDLPLIRPLRLKERTITKREGLVVTLTDEKGNQGQGEIAPLPAFSSENLSQAIACAPNVIERLISESEPIDWKNPPDSIRDHTYGSVRFGFESALLMLWSNRKNKSANKSINDAAGECVSINGLITEPDRAEIETLELLKAGFRSIKLKLGRQSVADDVAMVKKLQRAVGGKATLRLDVNRRWSVEDTLVFTEQVTGDTIEYLEEPVGSVDELRQLIDHKVKVALDESLMELPTGKLNEFLSSGSVAALVIKPTMLGLNKALELAKLANSYDVCAVISSSFESALGLTMLANMASAVNKTNIPAGLDTWRYFKKDLFDLPVSNSGDSFNLKSSMHPLVDIDLLKEITIV